MPLYQCYAPPGSLDDEQRVKVAQAITDIHCELTTAPPTFVHVQFHDRNTAGDAQPIKLSGGIRAGRPDAVTEELVSRISAAVSEIGGLAPDSITMRTTETPASWILEGGRVMPEPGQEAAWEAAGARA
ncbi:MAG: tautomerase family protein [Acidimicrobiales bacterium]